VNQVRRQNNFARLRLATGLLGFCLVTFCVSAATTNVVLWLNNGDRITGTLVSADTNQLVVATSWMPALPVPLAAITNREFRSDEPANAVAAAPTSTPVPVVTNRVVAKAKAAATSPEKTPAKIPKRWKTDLTLGLDLQSGAKERELYYGRFKFVYTLPYKTAPQKSFRTLLDYAVDYGQTDGVESANRMFGSAKADFDFATHAYIYNIGGAGYDLVRKIDFQTEVGPGVGYHLFRQPTFRMDVETGLNYQSQDRTTGEKVESVYARLAESVTWKPLPKVTLTERFEYFPNLDDGDQYRARLESTVSLALYDHLSLNLSLFNTYDTNPAAGVEKNEFLLRSSLGVSF